MTRELLAYEKLIEALKKEERFDQLSDADLDRIVNATLPGVPRDLQDEVLEIVSTAWWQNANVHAAGFLAEWEPASGRTRPN
jgi:hypothetical protein